MIIINSKYDKTDVNLYIFDIYYMLMNKIYNINRYNDIYKSIIQNKTYKKDGVCISIGEITYKDDGNIETELKFRFTDQGIIKSIIKHDTIIEIKNENVNLLLAAIKDTVTYEDGYITFTASIPSYYLKYAKDTDYTTIQELFNKYVNSLNELLYIKDITNTIHYRANINSDNVLYTYIEPNGTDPRYKNYLIFDTDKLRNYYGNKFRSVFIYKSLIYKGNDNRGCRLYDEKKLEIITKTNLNKDLKNVLNNFGLSIVYNNGLLLLSSKFTRYVEINPAIILNYKIDITEKYYEVYCNNNQVKDDEQVYKIEADWTNYKIRIYRLYNYSDGDFLRLDGKLYDMPMNYFALITQRNVIVGYDKYDYAINFYKPEDYLVKIHDYIKIPIIITIKIKGYYNYLNYMINFNKNLHYCTGFKYDILNETSYLELRPVNDFTIY